ncbi:MAG: xanthine dehydrogenase family protein subunit M [Alphaproteobacteria bacterium]|jgi:carbon-monoxide dehydrogenase medium subunit|nr:xanthine dehydrogenase family protein subunit M [Alphaproteobacteria bacterium]
MKAPDFDYQRPRDLTEALELLARHGGDAAIIAGGQSLLALLNFRLAAPELLIDIGRLAELKQLTEQDGHIEIGGLTRHCDIAASALIARELPLLHQAIGHIAHPAVRHRGTIGGSLAMADPAAELGACCLALDGQFSLVSARGQRWVAAGDFFQGVYETALQGDEILTAVRLPKPAPGSIGIFDETARRRGDFAMAGLALAAQAQNGGLRGVRLALLGVADRPILAEKTMAFLESGPLDESRIEEAAKLAAAETDPPEDPAYPPAYRRHLVGVLLRRALRELCP